MISLHHGMLKDGSGSISNMTEYKDFILKCLNLTEKM